MSTTTTTTTTTTNSVCCRRPVFFLQLNTKKGPDQGIAIIAMDYTGQCALLASELKFNSI